MSNKIWELIRVWGIIGVAVVFLLLLHLTLRSLDTNRGEILQNRQETFQNREISKSMKSTIDSLRTEIKKLKKNEQSR